MTIQEWGAIGEMVSAIAVVLTLGYLAIQIRYARLSATDASRWGRADGVREILLGVLASPESRRAWSKADDQAEARLANLAQHLGTTPEEADLVWYTCCCWAFLHWAQFRSMKTIEDHRELENLVVTFYSAPPMGTVWQHDSYLKALLDPGFVTWIGNVLASSRRV